MGAVFTFRRDEDALWRVYGDTTQRSMPLQIYLSRAQPMVFNCSEFLTLEALVLGPVCSIAHGPTGVLSTRPVSSRSTTTATLAMVIVACLESGLPSKNANVLCRLECCVSISSPKGKEFSQARLCYQQAPGSKYGVIVANASTVSPFGARYCHRGIAKGR